MKSRHLAVLGVVASTIGLGAAQPASAQFFPGDCMVSGGGQIRASNGDQATFGGNAQSDRDIAHEVYIDHGPVQPLRFRSLTVTAMVCNLDARTAEITGQGIVSTAFGDQIVQYRISVTVRRPQAQSFDRYRITLSNGYDSGEQIVIHGNLNMIER